MRVMIVEDDPATRERFANAIAGDLRTRLAAAVGTGREAIARLPAVRPDVLLVDLGLPDVHGTEVIRHAARDVPQCDIMVITMFGDERNVLASMEAGAVGYVLKDCIDADLVAQVVALRAGGAPMSPGIARMVLKRLRAAHDDAGPAAGITPRETEVLRLLARGYTYAETAEHLGISRHTVCSHIKNSYRKLAVCSAAEAVAKLARADRESSG
jgi:DNA-binding NarL/FixJ family response regulator